MIRRSWAERYDESLNDYISLKKMMILLNCSQPSAIQWRNKAKAYCNEKNIGYPGKMVPIEAVFAVTGKDRQYYYDMMLAESKSIRRKGKDENDETEAH